MSDSIASASELCVSYSSHTVLDGATLAIQQGDRIGLVGRNGCGKSTFLKILAGENVGDSGEVTRKRGLVTGYLPQNFELNDEANVIDNVLSGVQHVLDMIEEYEDPPPMMTAVLSCSISSPTMKAGSSNTARRVYSLTSTHLMPRAL